MKHVGKILSALALLAGCATEGPKPPPAVVARPATPATPAPRPSRPGIYRLTAPRPGDPKPVNANGLVGKIQVKDQEFIAILDGAKKGGPLTCLRLRPVNPAVKETVEIPLQLGGTTLYYSYGVVKLPGSDLVSLNVNCQVVCPGEVEVYFGGLYQSLQVDCDFAGKKHPLLAVDMNGSGKIGDVWKTQADKEGYLGLSPQGRGDQAFLGARRLYFGTPFMLDGGLWTLVAAADGKIMAQPVAGDTGTLIWQGSVKQKDPLIRLLGKTTMAIDLSESSNGRWILPAGDYRLSNFSYAESGRVAIIYNPALTLNVTPGKKLELAPVKTVAAKVLAGPLSAKREITLNLKMQAPDGATVVFYRDKDGAKTPAVRVLDAAGKEVYKGNFDYG